MIFSMNPFLTAAFASLFVGLVWVLVRLGIRRHQKWFAEQERLLIFARIYKEYERQRLEKFEKNFKGIAEVMRQINLAGPTVKDISEAFKRKRNGQ